nr:hypothetical protein Iba_chr10dCG11120 [Ipomoea batatas]
MSKFRLFTIISMALLSSSILCFSTWVLLTFSLQSFFSWQLMVVHQIDQLVCVSGSSPVSLVSKFSTNSKSGGSTNGISSDSGAEKLTEPVRKNGIQAVQVENPSSILPQEPAKVEEQNVINAENKEDLTMIAKACNISRVQSSFRDTRHGVGTSRGNNAHEDCDQNEEDEDKQPKNSTGNNSSDWNYFQLNWKEFQFTGKNSSSLEQFNSELEIFPVKNPKSLAS